MKSSLLALLMMGACRVASADAYTEAMSAWNQRDFATAFPAMQQLAKAGHPAAQLQLGEMYGFGEGVAEDMGAARQWLAEARASGHPDAAAALALMQQRAARKDEIAKFAASFDGGALAIGQYRCADPVLSSAALTNAEIAQTRAALDGWRSCYQEFSARMRAALPASRAIPADLAALMSTDEHARAVARVDQVYAGIVSEVRQRASAVLAQSEAWGAATAAQIASRNGQRIKEIRSALASYHGNVAARGAAIERGDTQKPPMRQ